LNRLFEQANALPLVGGDPKAASGEAQLNLGAVYTALLTLTPEMNERSLLGDRGELQKRALSALAQINQHRRLVLLGAPGSGKSTFVNFVALCLAGEALDHPQANLTLLRAPLPVDNQQSSNSTESAAPPKLQPWKHGRLLPVRVLLRDFAAYGLPLLDVKATADHLWRFIDKELQAAALGDYAVHLRTELLKTGGLILLDGLDEVPDAEQRRTQIKQAIEDFAHVFSRCRILVTSRLYAYQEQEWRLPKFSETVLAPFSNHQIRHFVDRWYAHIAEIRPLAPADAQGRAELLKRAIFASDRLLELAESPLLLTLTASLHAWRGDSLPERRVDLYAAAVSLLLDWWENQRVVREGKTVRVIQPSLVEWLKVDHEQVQAVLNHLAFQAHASQPTLKGTADIAEKELVYGLFELRQNQEVSPERLVEYLRDRAGLLLPRGVKIYTFPHRTFQEYLAACHFTNIDGQLEELADLTRKDPNRWREVMLLAGAKAAGGAASAIWSLIDALCFREPTDPAYTVEDAWGAHLAAQVLLEAANLNQVSPRNQPKIERVRRGLTDALQCNELPALERALAGRALVKLTDTRLEVMTIEQMQFCYVPAGAFTMGSQDDPHAYGDEKPQHTFTITYPYWISRYPITNAQFNAFVTDGGYGQASYWPEASQHGVWVDGHILRRRAIDVKDGRYVFAEERERANKPVNFVDPYTFPNHPVVGITWYEALAFTRWLTVQLNHAKLMPLGWAVQLPNEPEWEKAARGGLMIPKQPICWPVGAGLKPTPACGRLLKNKNSARYYPWGDQADANRMNFVETKIGTTSTVGCFPDSGSPYGVEEMSGNVWEWTRSLWGEDLGTPQFIYPYQEADGRERLSAGVDVHRVLRGGAFGGYDRGVRCAVRVRNNPDLGGNLIGFRVLVSPSPLVSGALDSVGSDLLIPDP